MAKNCIFCGNPAGCREHLWPKRIHDRHDFGPIRIQRGNTEPKDVPDPQIKVKSVCGACYNGWMSDLERSSIPLIGSMLQNLTLRLEVGQQMTLARWVTKTAMVLDSSRPRAEGARFYSADECGGMRKGLVIPARTRIWLGQIATKHIHAGMTNFLYSRQDNGKPMIRSWIGTFIVGHLAAQIITQHTLEGFDDHTVPDLTPRPGNWDNRLIQLWTAERDWLMWPPGLSFTNGGQAGVGHLVERFNFGDNIATVEPTTS